jgi:hypothetical protein
MIFLAGRRRVGAMVFGAVSRVVEEESDVVFVAVSEARREIWLVEGEDGVAGMSVGANEAIAVPCCCDCCGGCC